MTTRAHGAHLVGGLAAPDTVAAMTTAATILGRHLQRLTDGETGERSKWISWQSERLAALNGIDWDSDHPGVATAVDEHARRRLRVQSGVEIPPGTLGYATAARESYEVFTWLQTDGVIPAEIRFQVSLPTPFAVTVSWSEPDSQANLLRAYRDAMFAELRTIQEIVPAERLAIQWDVAVEVAVLERPGGPVSPVAELAPFERIVAELTRCIRQVNRPAQRGVHLCYGDHKHRHYVQPTDLALLVRIANAVAIGAPLDFVHMPVDREAGRSREYFAPLGDLAIGDAELALGVIDFENDSERIDELVANADAVGRPYAVAAECGMARIGQRGESVTAVDLLEQHRRVALPIR